MGSHVDLAVAPLGPAAAALPPPLHAPPVTLQHFSAPQPLAAVDPLAAVEPLPLVAALAQSHGMPVEGHTAPPAPVPLAVESLVVSPLLAAMASSV